jgi:threonine/homoserine/homoserine lactone efflux protein
MPAVAHISRKEKTVFTWDTLIMFITASTVLGFAPGPDNIFVLSQSVLYGRTAGFIITLGLCTGLLVHTAVVAFGVAAIFRTSALAFDILKYCGAAYLLYLAWRAFRTATGGAEGSGERLTAAQLYRRGIIMNVTNPKVSIFFLAFLPQFTDPSGGSMALQLIILGMIFIAVTLLVFGLISQLAGLIGRWFNRSPRGQIILNRMAGTIYIALAVKLIFTGQSS